MRTGTAVPCVLGRCNCCTFGYTTFQLPPLPCRLVLPLGADPNRHNPFSVLHRPPSFHLGVHSRLYTQHLEVDQPLCNESRPRE